MENKKIGINIIIERELVGKREIFITSSPDINVVAEGESIEEAKSKFLKGATIHLKNFPNERICLSDKNEEKLEMPMLSRIFL